MKPEQFGRALDRARKRSEQHMDALDALYRQSLNTAANEAARQLVSQATLTASDWQPPPEGTLGTGTAVTVALTTEIARTLETVMRKPMEQAGIAWDATDPLLVSFLEQTEAWAGESIGEAFQPELRKIITDAFKAGISAKDTAALIRSTFAETAKWQAEMLARSSLNMLGNGGMQVAVTRYNAKASAAGDKQVETKTWLTAGDSAVRPTHVAAAGQEVPVDQSFQVGGSTLQFPGDPGGALKEVLNCRCTAIYGSQSAATARRLLGAPIGSASMTTMRTRSKRRLARSRHLTAATIPSVQWVSDLAFEGTATADGRFMLPRSLRWRDLPLTLMAMTVTDDGHDGAFVAGRIDKINRSSSDIDGAPLPDGIKSLRGGGIFDMGGENGAEIARLVGDETLRGVSVDLAIIDWAFRDPDTAEIIEPTDLTDAQMERAFWGELQYAVRDGELLAATVCPTPAFADARIALAASGQQVLRLVSSFEIVDEALLASAAVHPPRDFFFTPEPDGVQAVTITDKGHFYGHAVSETCHTGFADRCQPPPRSPSDFAYFNNAEVVCSDGSSVFTGPIAMRTGHASLDPGTRWQDAKAHYENTGLVAVDVRATNGKYGIWVSGAVRPHLSDIEMRELRGGKISPDWRQVEIGGPLEMIGLLEVNTPGYPVPRPQAALAASALHPEGETVALIAAGIVDAEDYDRRLDVLEARLERGRDGLAALIG